MQETAQMLKAKILAGDKELTVEKFEELIQIKDKFTLAELQDFYKTFKSPLRGGLFTSYADVIFTHYPVVDDIRSKMGQKSKSSITKFFAKPSATTAEADAGKRVRDTEKIEQEKKSPKKKQDIANYFQKKTV